MRTIYVVMGDAGAYDNHVEWPVRAFTNKMKAEDFCDDVYERNRQLVKEYGNQWIVPDGSNELDPNGYLDDTTYSVLEIYLEENDTENEQA